MNLWRSGLILFVVSTANLPLHAQSPTEPQPASGLMVRFERVYDGEDACVLLNRSGDYRLERHFAHKTSVYLGVLGAEDVEQVRRLLDARALAQLSQTDIHRDMNSETIDKLMLDISRAHETQSLVFFDPESRKPFHDSLNPLLQWFNQMKGEPSTEIAATSANRCLPGQVADPPVSARRYLVFLDKDHVWSGGVERSCLVVYQDGRFRSERTAGAHLSHLVTRAVDGQLTDLQISELKATLDNPALMQKQQTRLNPHGFFQEAETIRLTIPRGNDTQQLTFLSADGRMGGRPGHNSGQPPTMNYADPDRHVIDPIESWIKRNVDKQKFAPVRDDKATECLPSN